MRKITFLFVLAALFPLSGKGQFLDTLSGHFRSEKKFIFRLDSRNSFVTSARAKIFGFKFGWEYNERVRIGIGFNYLTSVITKPKIYRESENNYDTTSARLRFNYISPFFEYVFFRNKRWEHTVPIQIGFGNSRYEYYTKNGTKLTEDYKPVIIYEPAMTTMFRVFPWVGVGAGVGYRLLLLNNNATNENFNSPIYVIKAKLFFGDLYRSIFRPGKAE